MKFAYSIMLCFVLAASGCVSNTGDQKVNSIEDISIDDVMLGQPDIESTDFYQRYYNQSGGYVLIEESNSSIFSPEHDAESGLDRLYSFNMQGDNFNAEAPQGLIFGVERFENSSKAQKSLDSFLEASSKSNITKMTSLNSSKGVYVMREEQVGGIDRYKNHYSFKFAREGAIVYGVMVSGSGEYYDNVAKELFDLMKIKLER